jgi:hypothetical protein
MGTGSERIAASSCHSENDELGSCEAHDVGSSAAKDRGVPTRSVAEGESAEESCLEPSTSALGRECKLPVDLRMKVRECDANIGVEFSYTRLIRSRAWLRRVIDEIIRKKFFENLEVSPALDLFGISADNRLRCF